jgi:hypothetical protein
MMSRSIGSFEFREVFISETRLSISIFIHVIVPMFSILSISLCRLLIFINFRLWVRAFQRLPHKDFGWIIEGVSDFSHFSLHFGVFELESSDPIHSDAYVCEQRGALELDFLIDVLDGPFEPQWVFAEERKIDELFTVYPFGDFKFFLTIPQSTSFCSNISSSALKPS